MLQTRLSLAFKRKAQLASGQRHASKEAGECRAVSPSRNGLYVCPLCLVIQERTVSTRFGHFFDQIQVSKQFLSAFLYVKYISLFTELITGHKLKRQEKAYLKDIWPEEEDAWNRYVFEVLWAAWKWTSLMSSNKESRIRNMELLV